MEPHWKEVIPGDQYVVSIDGPLNEGDQKVLSFLYQPLIGPICVSLYWTLRNQIEENRLSSEVVSHYYIMNLMDTNLQEIYAARQKLEAIGLLETYVKKQEDSRFFVYLLKPPLSPSQFFSDGLLNIYLYQKIGQDYYNRLKRFFADQHLPLHDFENITKEFQQVFSSSSSYAFYSNDSMKDGEWKISAKGEAVPVTVSPESFDFELLMAGLNEAVVPKEAITSEVKDVILKLSFLYGIDPIQMKNIVLGAINEQNTIDLEMLRKGARDWYTIEHYSSFPKLVDRIQSPIYHTVVEAPKTKEEQLIHYLETVSPRQLLEDLSEGSEPVAADLHLVEDVMFKQKLTPGVINVLIQYCLLRTDMKLTKGFVEKIASHWARKKVKTVPEAMELAKSENRQYLEWQQGKKEKKPIQRKPIRTEMVPDWFENRVQKKETEEEIDNFEEEKRKMEEKLKKYKK
ncbi:DnaD domain protein [Caldibacillus lycopersici]|uniref:DnaD domain protein n=1 Tax=Perspicuibacillus lycopersici TaxID=1325689 RepID=A0AAE3LN16_9BACI|nr:DnaD domain protein [Perspicuibacillus lycopersici]MCU9614170.1 DnaD domain protein [Perspicuibacillus lycopersici]